MSSFTPPHNQEPKSSNWWLEPQKNIKWTSPRDWDFLSIYWGCKAEETSKVINRAGEFSAEKWNSICVKSFLMICLVLRAMKFVFFSGEETRWIIIPLVAHWNKKANRKWEKKQSARVKSVSGIFQRSRDEENFLFPSMNIYQNSFANRKHRFPSPKWITRHKSACWFRWLKGGNWERSSIKRNFHR